MSVVLVIIALLLMFLKISATFYEPKNDLLRKGGYTLSSVSHVFPSEDTKNTRRTSMHLWKTSSN